MRKISARIKLIRIDSQAAFRRCHFWWFVELYLVNVIAMLSTKQMWERTEWKSISLGNAIEMGVVGDANYEAMHR